MADWSACYENLIRANKGSGGSFLVANRLDSIHVFLKLSDLTTTTPKTRGKSVQTENVDGWSLVGFSYLYNSPRFKEAPRLASRIDTYAYTHTHTSVHVQIQTKGRGNISSFCAKHSWRLPAT